MTNNVDVVVIGLGPGGEEVANRLVDAGLTVLGVERELVGGECPYWGCIPSKMMVRAAETLTEARRVHQLAGEAQVHPDYAPVARRIRADATDNWDDTVAVQRFEKRGGRFVRGQAMLVGPRPPHRQARWWFWAVAPSGWNWPRRSSGSGRWSPWWRAPTGCCRPRSPRPAR
ncbi:MAG: FAD-dependent oxidoreductase [Pseudonocardiaceae bacterium]